jgi:hypothetical protein
VPGLLSAKDPTFDERGQRIPHRNSKPRRVVDLPSGNFAADLDRGRTDIRFFARRFLGVDLHPGQLPFAVNATMRDADGYSPAFLDLALASGNQAGKTLILAIVVFHQSFYKLGIKRPDPTDNADVQRWARAPFHWYHISHEGKVANILHGELVKLFTGSHPAQKGRGCPLIDELGTIVEWDHKELGEYPWVRVHPGFGGGEIHFRHTNEKAKALLGLAMNGISYDEAAFELYLQEIRSEVLHLRRLTTNGPIYWISTGTEGYNAFADLWEEGNPKNPYRHPRSLSLRMSTRDNIGYGITQKQFDDLVATMDPRLIPQNIDGHFIEAIESYFFAKTVESAFDPTMEPETQPEKGHRYVQGADLGITSDATAVVVLDYTTRPWKGVRVRQRGGRQSIPAVVNMVNEGRLLYQQEAFCSTVVDATGMGGRMWMQEFKDIKPLRAFDFAGTKAKKLELLADLKAAIDKGALVLPRGGTWAILRRQLLGYKLDDKHIDTDLLMALAMAVRYAARNPSNPIANPTFSYFPGGSD